MHLRALAAWGLVLLASAAAAEVTGQQRAEAAGQELIGTLAPRAMLKTIDGQDIDLGSLYGRKAVYLKFWATWCVPCREQMPHFEHIYETSGPDLAVIAINAGFDDPLDQIQRYRRQLGLTMPIVRDDGSLGAAFNLRVTPQHIVIGRDGRILYVGHLANAGLETALRAAREHGPSPAVAGQTAGRARTDGAAVRIGDTLPALSVTTLDGKSFALLDHAGARASVFVFLSPWCESYLATTRPAISESCRRTREQVGELARNSRVRWLGIASGLWATPDELREYQDKYRVRIPLTLDETGTLFRTFRVTDVPTVLVADSTGKLIQRLDAGDPEALRKATEGL